MQSQARSLYWTDARHAAEGPSLAPGEHAVEARVKIDLDQAAQLGDDRIPMETFLNDPAVQRDQGKAMLSAPSVVDDRGDVFLSVSRRGATAAAIEQVEGLAQDPSLTRIGP